MAMSGIKVDPEAIELFNEIKMKKSKKYAFFKISDDGKRIVVDTAREAAKTDCDEEDEHCWEEMKCCLKGEEARFVVFDFRFKRKEGGLCEKMGFFLWCGESCKVKDKMTYAATKEAVKKDFKGYHYEFQAFELSDLEYSVHHAAIEKLR